MSGTNYQENHNHPAALCDCMLYWSVDGCDRALAVELKGNQPDIEHARKQMQNGAKVIDAIGEQFVVEFEAVLVSPRLDPMEQKELGRRRITFRGKRQFPAWLPSGSRIR
jgi:hypothetical protein